jgi:hypothetical protein
MFDELENISVTLLKRENLQSKIKEKTYTADLKRPTTALWLAVHCSQIVFNAGLKKPKQPNEWPKNTLDLRTSTARYIKKREKK